VEKLDQTCRQKTHRNTSEPLSVVQVMALDDREEVTAMPIPWPSRATRRASNQTTRGRRGGRRGGRPRAYIVAAVLLAVLCLLVLAAAEVVLLRSAGS